MRGPATAGVGVVFLLCSFSLFFPFSASAAVTNKKVSVSEVSFDSHVEDIQWCGAEHKTVLLKTRSGRLYRSKDGGKTWVEISELLKTEAAAAAPAAAAGGGGGGAAAAGVAAVDSIMVSPVNKNIVVVVGSKRNHFVSEDAAVSFRQLRYSSTIHNFHFHPTRSSYALLSTWTDACYSRSSSSSSNSSSSSSSKKEEECNHQLYYTPDLGRTFKRVNDYVVQFSWGDKTNNTQDNIYFTQHRRRTGEQPRYGGWSKNVDLMMTKDYGQTVSRLVYKGNKFLLSNGYFFVAKLKDAIRQTVTLLVSTDGGNTFTAAKLPVEIEEKSYTVLDTSEGAIMLHVNHGGEGGRDTGNVYISDGKGIRFSLSLPNNIRSGTGECEFDKVLSMEGVYIANFRDSIEKSGLSGGSSSISSTGAEAAAVAAAAAAEEEARMKQEEEEAEGIRAEVEKKHERVSSKGRREDVTRTAISFDKGGVWSYLKPPRVDSRGQKIDCSPDSCWLHLNGITKFNEYAPFYSVENAVGLIMGTGNVGSYLRTETDEINTYLSRDGGLTWIEAHKGAFIYEMGDHGGLLVMADDTKKTNQVVFSWNEGQSWYDFELGSAPLFVDNIVIEPNSSSVEFLLYGKRENDNAGVLFHLDFAALNQQRCKGIWAADSVSSDYETWSPSDGRTGEKCILGKHITYTRRKQTSECFNGRDFERPRSVEVCPCTIEDYECEYGFERAVGSVHCLPTDVAAAAASTAAGLNQFADEADAAAAAACTSSAFFYTAAYRKVPGDVCEGGWIPEKVAIPCPSHSPVSRGGKLVLLFISLIVLAMCIFNYLAKTGRLKALLRNTGFDTFANVSYAIVGSAPAAWEEDRNENNKKNAGEELSGRMRGTSKYEPELSFIDAEQEDNEEEAPGLLNYSQRGAQPRPVVVDSEDNNNNNINNNNNNINNNNFSSSAPSLCNRSNRNNQQTDASAAIPRLAPPAFDEDSMELL